MAYLGEDIPNYSKGEIVVMQIDEENKMLVSKGSSDEDFYEYCGELEAGGFSKLMSGNTNNISCAAYRVNDDYIYTYYCHKIRQMRVIRGPVDTFSQGECSALTYKEATPSITLIGQDAASDNGQGYIIMLPDGRLVIQDGGNRYNEGDKNDIIYKAILQIVPGNEPIVIAAWFLSHPHSDHVDAFNEFVENHGKDENINVERVIYNYASGSMYSYLRDDGVTENSGEYVDNIVKLCRENIPTAKLIKAHTGQVFDFGGAKVTVLFTVEDLLPTDKFDYVNSTSMVICLTIEKQSILFLADTTHLSGKILENMYGSSLRSDIVQIAHHGMWASNSSLYDYINAPVILWPTTRKTMEEWLTDSTVVVAMSYAKDIYVSDTQNTTLALPLVYNK